MAFIRLHPSGCVRSDVPGRPGCPERDRRALFPAALRLLRARKDVLAGLGTPEALVEAVVPIGEAVGAYEKFERGESGKVVLDVWA